MMTTEQMMRLLLSSQGDDHLAGHIAALKRTRRRYVYYGLNARGEWVTRREALDAALKEQARRPR